MTNLNSSSPGLVINVSFDSSVNSAPAGFVAAVDYVVNYYESIFFSPAPVNIDIGYGEIENQSLAPGALGESDPGAPVSYSYSAIQNALATVDPAAAASLPSSMPVSGNMWLTTAQAKALGLLSPSSAPAIDGYVGIGSGFNYTFDPNDRAVPGAFDFIGVVEHEFAEVMGRGDQMGEPLPGSTTPAYSLLDMFHYTAPGVHNYDGTQATYFSIDGGITNLDYFNTNPSGDPGDWASSAGADAYLAFMPRDQADTISQADIAEMYALGYGPGPIAHVAVAGTTSDAIQGGASVALLQNNATAIRDSESATLSSAMIRITNASGGAVFGDQLYVNGVQSGTVASGVTVSWNGATNTLALSGSATLGTYQTLLNEVTYQDTGGDPSSGGHPQRAVTWTVSDGTNVTSTTSQISIDRLPQLGFDSTIVDAGSTLTASATSGALANATDLDGDHLVVTGVAPVISGTGTVGAPTAGTYGHLTLMADGSFTYVADNSSAISAAPTGNPIADGFVVTVSDGFASVTEATLSIRVDRLFETPIAAAKSVNLGQAASVASLFNPASDLDGNTIQNYWAVDTNPSVGQWYLNGQPVSGTIAPSQIAGLSYHALAAGTDTIYFQAWDGQAWSASQGNSVTITVTAPPPPVETPVASTASMTVGNAVGEASLFNPASDPDGDTIQNYWAVDTNPSVGQWYLNGHPVSGTIAPSQISGLSYHALAAGTDTVYLQASDGQVWSPSQGNSVTVTVTAPVSNQPPVETPVAATVSMTVGNALGEASLFNPASDADGDTIQNYWAVDTNPSVGQWYLNGQPVSGTIAPSQVSGLSFHALAAGTDSVYLQASDGQVWSPWQGNGVAVTVTAPVSNQPPVETPVASTASMIIGNALGEASLFDPASDPDGDTIQNYWAVDTNPSVGQWYLNGHSVSGTIAPSQIAGLSYHALAAGTDTVYLQASDGEVWSPWQGNGVAVTVTAPVSNQPPVETPVASTASMIIGNALGEASLFNPASDPDGDTIQNYWAVDTNPSVGQWYLNGHPVSGTIAPSEIAGLSYHALSAGTDTIYFQASDGQVWSPWQGNGVTVTVTTSASSSVVDTWVTSSVPAISAASGGSAPQVVQDLDHDMFVFQNTTQAGATIENFDAAHDTINLTTLLNSLNLGGTDPTAKGTVTIDTSGSDSSSLVLHHNGQSTTLVTLDHVLPSSLPQTDIIWQ